jgi:hypothetical protein
MPLHIYSNPERMRLLDIKGYTTYIDDNGNAQRAELNPRSAFTTNRNKYNKNR